MPMATYQQRGKKSACNSTVAWASPQTLIAGRTHSGPAPHMNLPPSRTPTRRDPPAPPPRPRLRPAHQRQWDQRAPPTGRSRSGARAGQGRTTPSPFAPHRARPAGLLPPAPSRAGPQSRPFGPGRHRPRHCLAPACLHPSDTTPADGPNASPRVPHRSGTYHDARHARMPRTWLEAVLPAPADAAPPPAWHFAAVPCCPRPPRSCLHRRAVRGAPRSSVPPYSPHPCPCPAPHPPRPGGTR